MVSMIKHLECMTLSHKDMAFAFMLLHRLVTSVMPFSSRSLDHVLLSCRLAEGIFAAEFASCDRLWYRWNQQIRCQLAGFSGWRSNCKEALSIWNKVIMVIISLIGMRPARCSLRVPSVKRIFPIQGWKPQKNHRYRKKLPLTCAQILFVVIERPIERSDHDESL